MPKQQIRTDRVAAPSAHFSQAIAIEAKGKLVFVSGMTARRPDGTVAGVGDIEEQTRQVCENVRQALEAAGARMDDVCRIDVFLRNIGDRERFNKVRKEFWPANPPASTLVEVTKLASPEYLVEITAIAVASG
ncbi:MAG TPA: RidA family protein [Burkholderiales bacterium]|jgi:enamine deaminase RidA (YjgF/YER057c/UK114 family)|nr:RidA family protein [Burkholderiales bacterium]